MWYRVELIMFGAGSLEKLGSSTVRETRPHVQTFFFLPRPKSIGKDTTWSRAYHTTTTPLQKGIQRLQIALRNKERHSEPEGREAFGAERHNASDQRHIRLTYREHISRWPHHNKKTLQKSDTTIVKVLLVCVSGFRDALKRTRLTLDCR